MCVQRILYLVSKTLSENGNGGAYLTALVDSGELSKEDKYMILAVVQLKIAEQKLDRLLCTSS